MLCNYLDSSVVVDTWISFGVGVRRRSFDSGEIKRAADGGASIDCCCNYNAILAQSQMKLFGTQPAMDACVLLQLSSETIAYLHCMPLLHVRLYV